MTVDLENDLYKAQDEAEDEARKTGMEFANAPHDKLYSRYPNNFIAIKLAATGGEVMLSLLVKTCAVCHSVEHPRMTAKFLCPIPVCERSRFAKTKCKGCQHPIYQNDMVAPLMGQWMHRDDVLALTLPVVSMTPPVTIVRKYTKNDAQADFLRKLFCTSGNKLVESPGGGGKTADLVAGSHINDPRTCILLSESRNVAEGLKVQGVLGAKTIDSLTLKCLLSDCRSRMACLRLESDITDAAEHLGLPLDTANEKYDAMLMILFPPKSRENDEKANVLHSAEFMVLHKFVQAAIVLAMNRGYDITCSAPTTATRAHLSPGEQMTMFQDSQVLSSWLCLDEEYDLFESHIQPILDDKILTREQSDVLHAKYGEGVEMQRNIKDTAYRACIRIFRGALEVVTTGTFLGKALVVLLNNGEVKELQFGLFNFVEARHMFVVWRLQGVKFHLRWIGMDEYQQATPLTLEVLQLLEYQSNLYLRNPQPPTMVCDCCARLLATACVDCVACNECACRYCSLEIWIRQPRDSRVASKTHNRSATIDFVSQFT